MTNYCEIVPGKLWAGNIRSIQNIPAAARCVLSILPIGNRDIEETARKLRSVISIEHRILITGDFDSLPPLHIRHALRPEVPILIHCNAGYNRSTALAACWLLEFGGFTDPWAALQAVAGKRQADLGEPLKIFDAMEGNVERYAKEIPDG